MAFCQTEKQPFWISVSQPLIQGGTVGCETSEMAQGTAAQKAGLCFGWEGEWRVLFYIFNTQFSHASKKAINTSKTKSSN